MPTAFQLDYNFHEEEDIANTGDSELEDNDSISIRPRISNESNSSRPISLSEFERISMKNNITKPLLKSNDINLIIDPNLQFLDKSSQFTDIGNGPNINELPDIRALRGTDKVSKRPISEVLSKIDTIEGAHGSGHSANANVHLSEILESPNGERNRDSNISVISSNIKRTISANEYDSKTKRLNAKLSHRRTQSYAAAGTVNRISMKI